RERGEGRAHRVVDPAVSQRLAFGKVLPRGVLCEIALGKEARRLAVVGGIALLGKAAPSKAGGKRRQLLRGIADALLAGPGLRRSLVLRRLDRAQACPRQREVGLLVLSARGDRLAEQVAIARRTEHESAKPDRAGCARHLAGREIAGASRPLLE